MKSNGFALPRGGWLSHGKQTRARTHTPKNRCLKHTCSNADECYLLQSYIFALNKIEQSKSITHSHPLSLS